MGKAQTTIFLLVTAIIIILFATSERGWAVWKALTQKSYNKNSSGTGNINLPGSIVPDFLKPKKTQAGDNYIPPNMG